jgi:hypothetical protein
MHPYAFPYGIVHSSHAHARTHAQLHKVLGLIENSERFLQLALFQGVPLSVGASAEATLGAGLIAAKDSGTLVFLFLFFFLCISCFFLSPFLWCTNFFLFSSFFFFFFSSL